MDDPVVSHATGVRRANTGRVAVQLDLDLVVRGERKPTWIAVDAAHGQIHVEILDDAEVAEWPVLVEEVQEATDG